MKTKELIEFASHNPKVRAIISKPNEIHLLYPGMKRDVFVLTAGQWEFSEQEQIERTDK